MSLLRWVCGDPATSLTIAANGSLECGPVDLNNVDISTASINLERTGGTGTLKMSAEISPDGVTNSTSLGDIITDVTDTPKTYSLSDPGFTYGRFLILTVTETGTAASAAAQSVFQGQSR